jgi:catechol 2,3-dioxygenase-like lactoylglutathione lyase family enzyme
MTGAYPADRGAIRAYGAAVITGAHVILYSSDAAADRAFLRDLLGLPHVDAGGGWTVVQLPPAEVAVHPADRSGAVELYLVCDDVGRTVADLGAAGIPVLEPVTDQGWGLLTAIGLPGGGRVGLYEARHPTAFDA